MKRLLPFLFVVLLARPAAALPHPSALEIERLIKQLGANDFAVREKASAALAGLGERAEPALRRATVSSGDAEVRRRARRLLESALAREWTRGAQRMQGVWHVEEALYGGAAVTVWRERSFTFEGDRFDFNFNRTSGGVFRAGPDGALDLHFSDGLTKGIYRFDGDGLLLCWTWDGRERPTRFGGSDEARRPNVLLRLKRGKP